MPRSQCRHGENGLWAATPLGPSLGRLGRLATVFAWFRQEPTASPLSPFMSSAAALMPGGPRTLSTCSHLTRKRFRPSRCSCRLLGRTCSSHLNFRCFSRTLETLPPRITPRVLIRLWGSLAHLSFTRYAPSYPCALVGTAQIDGSRLVAQRLPNCCR